MAVKEVQRETHQIDAAGKPLGRLASQIATLLRGKHKPSFQPHIDGGDFVEIVNADQVKVTGGKATQKMYHRHSGHPGGLKSETYAERVARRGHEEVIQDAVYNMLPTNKLRAHMMKRLVFKKEQA